MPDEEDGHDQVFGPAPTPTTADGYRQLLIQEPSEMPYYWLVTAQTTEMRPWVRA
ncbi:hypothetical protein ACFPH6_40085 [Streptomyces xiangluensis]|uniref:Uncharacterized protein n=1 Tax=Streptomyces xiangluensis TaxID=2665720 RepID=A0ABV8Z180_9ACTN